MLREELYQNQSQAGGIVPGFGSGPGEYAWYVVQTLSRHEVKVAGGLWRKGIETFLPKITVPSRRLDRKVLLRAPLFPGYLFVYVDLAQAACYSGIITERGVVRLLGLNHQPSPVSAAKVESIKAIVNSNKVYYPWPYLEKGSQIRIIDGPLAGTVGAIIERRENKRRVVVSIELFKRAIAVELDQEAVEKWS